MVASFSTMRVLIVAMMGRHVPCWTGLKPAYGDFIIGYGAWLYNGI